MPFLKNQISIFQMHRSERAEDRCWLFCIESRKKCR